MFKPLNESEIESIVKLQLEAVIKLLKENGIALQFSDNAIKKISETGFDPQFGARPVKRAIQKHVLNDLSKKIIEGKIDSSRPILIDERAGVLNFEN